MAEELRTELQTTEKRGPGRPPSREAREGRDETRAETGRRERIPLGTPRLKMSAQAPKGMVGHWFNDVPGRIAAVLDAGYQFINDSGTTGDRESARTMRVGVNEDGSVQMAFYMAIPEEWYREDQKAKMKPIDEFDAAIKRGTPQGAAPGDQQAFYDKGSTIKRA